MTRRFVIEADGGSRGNPGPAAYGAVVRDADTGDVLAERAATIGIATNNVAEYRGLIAGLRAARDLDRDAVLDVRLDSKLLVEQMSGRWKVKNPDLRSLAIAARDLAPSGRVTYTWIPREKNKAADALVNAALDAVESGRPFDVQADDFNFDGVGPGAQLTFEPQPPRPRPAIPGWGPDLGPATTMQFVRHGVTAHTLDRRFSGSGGADLDLSDVGRAQAAAVAQELRQRGGADLLISSPMRRTLATAASVASELGLAVHTAPDLRECAFGEWDGLTFAEVASGWPQLMREWLNSPDVSPPGGESLRSVAVRVNAAIARLVADAPGVRLVIVTHMTPIRVAVGSILDAPLSAITRLEIPPTSITTLAAWSDGNKSLRGFGDIAHWPQLVRRDS
jgi:broad specificity phosphatase PhoE/ribonuclease HI